MPDYNAKVRTAVYLAWHILMHGTSSGTLRMPSRTLGRGQRAAPQKRLMASTLFQGEELGHSCIGPQKSKILVCCSSRLTGCSSWPFKVEGMYIGLRM